jgi:hypothetical protein
METSEKVQKSDFLILLIFDDFEKKCERQKRKRKERERI